MRPVARIAQSVEQGIENPRVLGSIPSPGTTYSENPAYGWVLLSVAGLFIELRSIIRRTAAHPFGASVTRALFNACGVSPSPGTTYSENPAYGWVLLSVAGLFIELRSIIRRTAAHPFGASATRALFNACGVSPSPGTTI